MIETLVSSPFLWPIVVCGVAATKMARASHLHLTWRDRHHGVLPHIVQH